MALITEQTFPVSANAGLQQFIDLSTSNAFEGSLPEGIANPPEKIFGIDKSIIYLILFVIAMQYFSKR